MSASPAPAPEMEQAWIQLAAHLGTRESVARATFTDVVRRYATETRVYHTLEHAWRVAQRVNDLAPYAQNLTTVQMAAWLHDVIYNTQATDNETRSAAYAAELLERWKQPQGVIFEVQRLILLTKRHEAAPDDGDGRVLSDADLAILGAPPAAYARYSAAIRREYGWVSDEAYGSGRLAVLQRFLQRPFIYTTPPMRREREQAARANLQAEIERLS